MKIAIVTQSLLNNYGGILQNFALQRILQQEDIIPVTIDWLPPRTPLTIYILSWLKTLLLRFVGKKRPFATIKRPVSRDAIFNTFIKKNIFKTQCVSNFAKVNLNDFDVIIVGSDQVWRPKYNCCVEDMYLKFAQDLHIKRIAYAASFGVDEWEYSEKLTRKCRKLVKKFDAVSVREESGIELSDKYLGINATWVLDPTLLLKKEDYCEICKDVPVLSEKILVAYVLDLNESIRELCESVAKERCLTLKIYTAGTKAMLTIPEWIAMFRDASYVVTDSFHGTIFSIIFGKKFKCIYNKRRGSARFDSLLDLYNSEKIDEMREFSLNWLKSALEK